MEKELEKVDHSAIRTSQVSLLLLLIVAFILNTPLLVALIAIVLLTGMFRRRPAFDFVYTRLLRPLGWVKPDVIPDHPEPHRFSQLLATIFISASAVFLFAGAQVAGWVLSWIVISLAALNAFGGFCVGCAVYYWLARLNVPLFTKSAPEGAFPGRRPKHVTVDQA